jgi:putative ABC transport system substrate-binding protein
MQFNTKRREFISLIGSAVMMLPLPALAQSKRARIGWFSVAPHPYIDAFRRGLRELGWIEGESLVIEPTYAEAIQSGCQGSPRCSLACPTI